MLMNITKYKEIIINSNDDVSYPSGIKIINTSDKSLKLSCIEGMFKNKKIILLFINPKIPKNYMDLKTILQEAREEFVKKFSNPTAKYMGNDFAEYPKANIPDVLNFLDSTLQAFIEAEIKRLEGMKMTDNNRYDSFRKWLNASQGIDGWNNALSDQISHYQKLLVTILIKRDKDMAL